MKTWKKALLAFNVVSMFGVPLVKANAQEQPQVAELPSLSLNEQNMQRNIKSYVTERMRVYAVALRRSREKPIEVLEQYIDKAFDLLAGYDSLVDTLRNSPEYEGVDFETICNAAADFLFNSFVEQLDEVALTRE